MFTQVIIRKQKTDGRTDRRTDGLTDDQRDTIIPRHYCVAGYKKSKKNFLKNVLKTNGWNLQCMIKAVKVVKLLSCNQNFIPCGIYSCPRALYMYTVVWPFKCLLLWICLSFFYRISHVEVVLTIYSNGFALLNKMAAMVIYGKTLKNLFQNQGSLEAESGYIAAGTQGLPTLFKCRS